MNPLEQQFYWLGATCDAWGLFWGHMMDAARFIGPQEFNLENVVEVDFSRKGE